MPHTSRPKLFVLWLFFFSGISGLIYEVVWARLLERVMGASVYSITTVLTVYMAGLALGSFVAGKIIDRRDDPLRVYGVLEGVIGVYCLLIPAIILATTPIYRAAYGSFLPLLGDAGIVSGLSLVRFGISALVLIIPTTFMGATLPVLSKYVSSRYDHLGQSVGELYAVNMFGAVVGSFASGFVLMPILGITGTIVTAAAINLGVAGVVIWLHYSSLREPGGARKGDRKARARAGATAKKKSKRRQRPSASDTEQQPARKGKADREFLGRPILVFLLVAFALSGFATMVYQVSWMRTLSLVIGSSVYALSLTLTALILGLALGAAIFARIVDKNRDLVGTMSVLEIGIGVSSLAVIPILGRLPLAIVGIVEGFSDSFGMLVAAQFFFVFLVLLVPTFLMGGLFPVVCKAFTKRIEEVGRSVGDVYASNIVGAMIGAFAGVFMLVPILGIERSIGVAVLVNMALGIALIMLSPIAQRAKKIAVTAVAVIATLGFLPFFPYAPRWDRAIISSGAYLHAHMYLNRAESMKVSREDAIRLYGTVEYHREGVATTVTVRRSGNHLYLQANGKIEVSTADDMKTQRLLAHVPMMLHPDPKDVLIVGLATGITVGSVETYPVDAVDCVEIAPAMVEVAASYFSEANGNCLDDPRLSIFVEDGRNHVAFTDREYDVLISEPSNPHTSGISNLFTREFFELARDRMKPGGIVGQWLQAYNMSVDDYRMIVRTFADVFPHVSIWELDPGVDYMLVGSTGDVRVHHGLVSSRLKDATIGPDLASVGVSNPSDYVGLLASSGRQVTDYVGDGPVHTDDDLKLEFSAPKNVYLESEVKQLEALGPFRTDPADVLAGLPEGEEARAILDTYRARAAARSHVAMGIIAEDAGELEEAVSQYEQALLASPGEPEAMVARSRLLCRVGAGLSQRQEYEEAADLFRAAIDGGGDFPQPFCMLGAALIRLGRLDEAMVELERAIALDPEYAEAYFNLALVYESKGMVREQMEALENYVEHAPAASNVRQLRSEIARLKGVLESRGN